MDWIKENMGVFLIIVVVIVIVILAVAIVQIIMLARVKKSLSTTALKITSALNYDSDNLGETLAITIFNNNYRDIILHDFGFIYKNQQISFIDEYSERKTSKGRACVPSRSSLSYKVNPERIEKFVVAHNFNATSIDKIKLYVSDAVGNKVIVKDKSLTNIFGRRQKARLKLAKVKIHQEKVREYQASHEGNAPISDKFWKMFHSSDIKIPELLKKSSEYIDDNTVTPNSSRRPDMIQNSISSSDPTIENDDSSYDDDSSFPSQRTRTRTSTQDMKVTFIDLDVPLKAKNINSKDKK